MHRVLKIAEMFSLILDALSTPETMHLPRETVQLVAGRDIATLARTCRAFSDPCFDRLWRFQTTLDNLVRCLPDDCWTEYHSSLPVVVTIPYGVEPHEWAPAQKYAKYIRTLSLQWPCSHSSIFKALTDVDVPRFSPNLRTLVASNPYYNVFLCPSLRSVHLLHVDVDADVLDPAWLPLAKLTELTICSPFSFRYAPLCPTLSTLALQLRCVEVLELDAVDWVAMQHISILPRLRSLALHMGDVGELRGGSLLFPTLETLRLHSTSVEFATVFVSLLECDIPLIEMTIESSSGSSPKAVEALYRTIAERIAPSTLQALSVIVPNAASTKRITGQALAPLLHFTNLAYLILRSPTGFALTDTSARAIARAFRHLVALKLLGSPATPDNLTTMPTGISLSGLLFFALHNPRLHTLSIPIDARAAPPRIDTFGLRCPGRDIASCVHYTLATLSPTRGSAIANPDAVARFVGAVFPDVWVKPPKALAVVGRGSRLQRLHNADMVPERYVRRWETVSERLFALAEENARI